MSQVSSSFPSYDDDWDDSTNATEYYDIDDHNAVDNDVYYDEYDEPEDHDGGGSTCLASLRTLRSKSRSWPVCWRTSRMAKRGRAKVSGEAKKGWSKGESGDVLKLSTMEAGKGGRPENYKQVRVKLQSDRLIRGWRDQPAHGTNKGSWSRTVGSGG